MVQTGGCRRAFLDKRCILLGYTINLGDCLARLGYSQALFWSYARAVGDGPPAPSLLDQRETFSGL